MKQFLQRPRSARTQGGIALLECLMALLIFSVGLLGLLGLEARVMNISVDSENRGRAALLASEIASQMWINNTVAPTTTAYNNLVANAGDQTQGGLPGGVATVTQIGTTNVANITITWQEISDAPATPSTLTTQVILP
jgi:type IV pilus assembly protein PilV